MNAASYSLSVVTVCLCVQLVGDSHVLKEKVAHCQLRRLELYGRSTTLLPLLNGVKYNLYITYLHVFGEPITTSPHVTILYHVQLLYYTCYSVCHKERDVNQKLTANS